MICFAGFTVGKGYCQLPGKYRHFPERAGSENPDEIIQFSIFRKEPEAKS